VIFTTWQPVVTLPRGRKVRLSHLGELRIALDQDGSPAAGDGGDARSTAAAERVDDTSVGRRERAEKVRHQENRLRGRVRIWITDPRHEEESVRRQLQRLGEHQVRGVATALGLEGRTLTVAVIEGAIENSFTPAAARPQRVDATHLLAVSRISERESRLVNVDRRRPRAWRPRDHDRCVSWPQATRVRWSAGRECPNAHVFDQVPGFIDRSDHSVIGTRRADRDERCTRFENAADGAPQLCGWQYVPRLLS
jgi:hypothetical protein